MHSTGGLGPVERSNDALRGLTSSEWKDVDLSIWAGQLVDFAGEPRVALPENDPPGGSFHQCFHAMCALL
ncbi:beta-lactamase [Anopheles sinensis]|uniref:Beta-lactamase n=1 Tax=Anopheles sinensis TaxID=74873 RepID=A0A084VYL0_ANOSI|nr:beta-lactamase [Anopheles sinensis]